MFKMKVKKTSSKGKTKKAFGVKVSKKKGKKKIGPVAMANKRMKNYGLK